MRTVTLLAVLSSLGFAQSDRTACSMALGVENEYRSLPSMSDLSRSWEERYAPRRALARKYPSDWPLQVALQMPIQQHSDMRREWDLAIEHYRAVPDRLLGELLEARLLSPVQHKTSRGVLDRILRQAKDSPWAHLAMLEWAADARNGDRTLAEREFEAFRQMCPGDQYVFRFIEAVRDTARLRHHVEALRSAIEADKKRRLEDEELDMVRTAWTLEQVTYGRDHLDEYLQVVRSDVGFLRDHPMWGSGTWIFMYSLGSEGILKDDEVIKSFPDEILAHAPKSDAAYLARQERWRKENPRPANPVEEHRLSDAQQAYDARYAAFSLALLRDFWGQAFAGFDAVHLLFAEQLSADTVKELADFALSSAERFPDQGTSTPPNQVLIAEAYVARKIHLDLVPVLIEKGIQQSEDQTKYYRDGAALEKSTRAGEDSTSETKRRAREILIQHAIVTGQMERARVMLNDFRRELDLAKSLEPTTQWRNDQFTYEMLARRAGIDIPIDLERLNAPQAEPERFPVAQFEAKDLSGKTWSLADLQGKVTYVGIWRSGCRGACGAALQGVQQLYERWKGRSDRAVLTISVDENVAIAESLMKDNEYSFPMIYGAEIAVKFLPNGGWPTAWLIDPKGRRLQRRLPYPSDETIPKIEEMADRIELSQ